MNQIVFAGDPPLPGEKARILKLKEKDPQPKNTLIAAFMEIYPARAIGLFDEYIKESANHDKMGVFRAWLLEKNKLPLYGYTLRGTWFDIGTPESLFSARDFFRKLLP